MRKAFVFISVFLISAVAGLSMVWPSSVVAYVFIGPLVLLGFIDMLQTKHAVRRNFPVVGHGRYLLEMIRPEINQYFIESNTDGAPFSREDRSLVYQRAKGELDTLPFGTQRDVYAVGYEWMDHSLQPRHPPVERPRVLVGEETCKQPYSASVLNISAMSYGSLSKNAILALNAGAKEGGFAHNTGEGGLSPYHLAGGGDVIWQVGTGYFGCRTPDGTFDRPQFADKSAHAHVKMIELKLSQGAKPGHGGILPAKKVTPEIAAIRLVPMGRDVISPPAHAAFSTPIGLLEFLTELRELSGGKPVGFKLCIGNRSEFLAICKAMVETGLHPDFITVDGSEGGTGAAPLEFSNSLGTPLTEGLIFVHNALRGIGFRDRIRVIASGKIVCGFDIARALALGADMVNSARAMMMAIGCIQARRCNNNSCPVGVATQKPELVGGLVVADKSPRVARFHRETVESFQDLIAALGLESPSELRPWHIHRRVSSNKVSHYGELFEFLEDGALLGSPVPESYAHDWQRAQASSFWPIVPPHARPSSEPRRVASP